MDIKKLFSNNNNSKHKPLRESKVEIIIVLSIMAIALILSLILV